MAFAPIKDVLAGTAQATPGQVDEWRKAWRAATDSGSPETLLGFIARERGVTEDLFLQQLAKALNWPYLDLPKITVPPEVRQKVSTKVAFQHSVIPVAVEKGVTQI